MFWKGDTKLTYRSKITVILSLVMIMLLASPALAAVSLDINGRPYQSSDAPNLKDGSVLTPLEVLENTLGCSITVQDKTITFKENQDTLILTIGSKTASFNGQDKVMPCAPQLINSKVYVPLRFVFECFGAKIAWQNDNETVKVAYNETRNGITAAELMAESSAKINQAGRYKMLVKSNTDMDMTMQEKGKAPETMKVSSDADITAWCQMLPMLMYMQQKALVKAPNTPTPEPQTVETEVLLNENGMYMTMPNIGWVKMDLPMINLQDMMKQSMNQDPASTMQQMKDMGMSLAFANDEEKNGRKYWVVKSKMGNDALKSDYYKKMVSQMQVPAGGIDLREMMNSMQMDMSYSTWIDQATLYNDYITLTGKMKYTVDVPASQTSTGGKMTMVMDITAAYTISDYGKTFSVPDVSKAQAMKDVAPQK